MDGSHELLHQTTFFRRSILQFISYSKHEERQRNPNPGLKASPEVSAVEHTAEASQWNTGRRSREEVHLPKPKHNPKPWKCRKI
jgi:hypothetical protein